MATVLVSACMLATSCSPSGEEATELDNVTFRRPSEPVQVVEDGYFEYTERGKIVQSLEAHRLERWDEMEEPSQNALWQVDQGFTLYIGGSKSTHNARLSATRGTYDDKAGRLEAWDEVLLVNEAGEELRTEHLIWSHDSDLIRTHRPVEILTSQGVLRGRGMKADSHFERYEILAPTGSFELGMASDSTEAALP